MYDHLDPHLTAVRLASGASCSRVARRSVFPCTIPADRLVGRRSIEAREELLHGSDFGKALRDGAFL